MSCIQRLTKKSYMPFQLFSTCSSIPIGWCPTQLQVMCYPYRATTVKISTVSYINRVYYKDYIYIHTVGFIKKFTFCLSKTKTKQ